METELKVVDRPLMTNQVYFNLPPVANHENYPELEGCKNIIFKSEPVLLMNDKKVVPLTEYNRGKISQLVKSTKSILTRYLYIQG